MALVGVQVITGITAKASVADQRMGPERIRDKQDPAHYEAVKSPMNPRPRSLTSFLIVPAAIAAAPLRTSVRDLLRFLSPPHYDAPRACFKPPSLPGHPLRTAPHLQARPASSRPTTPFSGGRRAAHRRPRPAPPNPRTPPRARLHGIRRQLGAARGDLRAGENRRRPTQDEGGSSLPRLW